MSKFCLKATSPQITQLNLKRCVNLQNVTVILLPSTFALRLKTNLNVDPDMRLTRDH